MYLKTTLNNSKKKLGKHSTYFIISILSYTERFIDVLNTFISKKPHFSYYSDKSTLNALLIFKLIIHIMVSDDTTVFDDAIIGIVLEIINEIQRFLIMYCNVSPSNNADTNLYEFL